MAKVIAKRMFCIVMVLAAAFLAFASVLFFLRGETLHGMIQTSALLGVSFVLLLYCRRGWNFVKRMVDVFPTGIPLLFSVCMAIGVILFSGAMVGVGSMDFFADLGRGISAFQANVIGIAFIFMGLAGLSVILPVIVRAVRED